MRTQRFRYLVVFVAAMFIANSAVASVSASVAGLGRMAALAAMHVHPAAERVDHAAHVDIHCIAQCIQSYRDPKRQFANNGLTVAPKPASPDRGLSVRAEPTAARITWAPMVAGPKLSILFGNLRN